MVTEEQITESLEWVFVPGAMRSLTKLNLVRGITISDQKVEIALASTALDPGVQEWLKTKIIDTVKDMVHEVKEVRVNLVEAKPGEINQIHRVVAVMSGKGGVGKSLVSGLLGLSLARHGYETGILDADITGPSIPKMFGITTRPAGAESGILPVLSRAGIEIMSINLMLEHEDDAVIWRGPLIGKAIQQFWGDVLWGKLDYLIVDLPPGTADAPLTVMQSLPVSGVVLVFSPQELAGMVVMKAAKMAEVMKIPILGVVENYSYFILPETGKRLEIFGKSRGEEMAKSAKAPLLAEIPIDPEIARLCDQGDIERYDSEILHSFAEAFLQAVLAKTK
jgi:hydrogenase maturation protease